MFSLYFGNVSPSSSRSRMPKKFDVVRCSVLYINSEDLFIPGVLKFHDGLECREDAAISALLMLDTQ